jgi:hypothetical protein
MVQPPLKQISPDKVGGTAKEIVKMTTIDQQEGITENLTNTTKSFIFTEAKTTRYHRASGLVLLPVRNTVTSCHRIKVTS